MKDKEFYKPILNTSHKITRTQGAVLLKRGIKMQNTTELNYLFTNAVLFFGADNSSCFNTNFNKVSLLAGS